MNWKRFTVFVFTLLAVVLMSYQPAHAQANVQAGSIQGVVTDPQGGVVPNAKVIATEAGTNARVRTESDTRGQYVLPFLAPGRYDLSVEASGCSSPSDHSVR